MGDTPPTYYEFAVSRWPRPDLGKCRTCGLLAMWDGPNDKEIRLADRDAGNLGIKGGSHFAVFCVVNAANLQGEFYAQQTAHTKPLDAAKTVINMDRKCPRWHPYTPGASPLWHIEDMRMHYLEQRRDVMRDLDNRLTWRIALMGAFLAVAQILVAIIVSTHQPPVVVNVPPPTVVSAAR